MDDPNVVDIRDLQRRARERRRREAREAWKEAELAAAVARAHDALIELYDDDESQR